MQLAVDRAHGDQALGDGRWRQHLPVQAHFPSDRTVGGVEAKNCPSLEPTNTSSPLAAVPPDSGARMRARHATWPE